MDVGGESTRPGAQRITAEEELRRVGPVIDGLVAAGVPVSVDTMRAEVAERALEAGARLVNDVSGGLADPQMPRLVGGGRGAVCGDALAGAQPQHGFQGRLPGRGGRGERGTVPPGGGGDRRPGVDPAMIVLDPGLGFAKRPEHNWALLTHLDEVSSLGGRARPFPVLIGASRKRFLGRLLAAPGRDTPPVRRLR